MNIDELVTRIYEKHRIHVKRDDPLFQILTLVLERSYETEKERHDLIQKQIDVVVRGTINSLNAHAVTLKQDASDVIRDGMVRIDNLIDQRLIPSTTENKDSDNDRYKLLLILTVLNFAGIIALLFLILLSD